MFHPQDWITANTQFRSISSELNKQFPDLDLRFTMQQDSRSMRFRAAAVSESILELDLGDSPTENLLHQAIFAIKELASLFDA